MKSFSKFCVASIVFSASILFPNLLFSQNMGSNSYSFTSGVSNPTKDLQNFASQGFNTGLAINKDFCSNVSVALQSNYTAMPLKTSFGAMHNKWSNFSLSFGPQYRIKRNSVFVQLYGKLGIAFKKSPEFSDINQETGLTTLAFNANKTNGLSTQFGIQLGATVCNGLDFFMSTEYASIHNGNTLYQTRDLSSAIDAKGQIDRDLASEIPFETKSVNFSSFNVNFGIRIALSNNGNRSSNATDYNSSRSNRSTSIINNDNNNGGNNSRATDYNSSRSNKNGAKSAFDGNNNNGNGNRSANATDYNSSRSNKSEDSDTIDNGDNDGNSSENNSRATDYNSSRSNKNGAKSAFDGNNNNGNGNRSVNATDYNSSRSNKSENSGAIDNGDNDGNNSENNSRATDYNSSRSNKNGAKSAFDENNNNGNDNRSANATDYNSSRSNRSTSAMANNQGNEETMEGILLGLLLGARQFEFSTENHGTFNGTISSEISNQQLAKYSRLYLNKKCVIVVKTAGNTPGNFELVEIKKSR